MTKKQRIPHKFLPWIDARKKFRLSNAHIQMARELGLSPKRFGVYADNKDQPWKVPLPEFIENQYKKQFDKDRPDVVLSIEEIAAAHVAKRVARKARKLDAAEQETPPEDSLAAEEVAVEEMAEKLAELTEEQTAGQTTEPVTEKPIEDSTTEPRSQTPSADN
jgi:hypothetical protein